MDKIQLLPDSVANQIAAGEVIQRPASVIKELVENSVDAGAKNIQILVTDAGRTSIQVCDDGIGMSPTDARLCFERHATSKIRKTEDLFDLHTMGFRGEALPSIAAVAQVTLKTRQENDAVGTCLSIAGSKFVSQEPVQCPRGTNFLIENLFFNVPVRRRFLKTNSTELNNIVTAFLRIALVYPDIAFSLHSNGQELYNLMPGNTMQRIVEIFGKKLNQSLLPIDADTSLCKITGFIGKPEAARKKGAQQFFFVNGRYMKHPYFLKAVMSAYDRLVPQGEQVPFFIYFKMNPEDIDVNIHPTKTDIKFQDEQTIWQILSAAVRESVGKFSNIPTIDFDNVGKPEIPLFDDSLDVAVPKIDINPAYNPFSDSKASSAVSHKPAYSAEQSMKSHAAVPNNWESLYEGLDFSTLSDSPANAEASLFEDQQMMASEATREPLAGICPPYYQYKGSYIVASVNSGMAVIDQVRAHERILFERYLSSLENRTGVSQRVLFPEVVQFTVSDMVALPTILPEMEALGFELTNLGGGSYAINSVPSGLDGINMVQLVSDMVSSAAEETANVRSELFSSLAATMARNAAVPCGQVLSNEEMETMVSDLMRCDNTNYTPNGKSIYAIIPHNNILQMLG